MERDAYDRPERTVKFLCDEQCNKCVVMENRQVALLMNVLLEVYGDGVNEIANSICPNMTCCPDCRIDDFFHEGDDDGRSICEIEREARRIARSFRGGREDEGQPTTDNRQRGGRKMETKTEERMRELAAENPWAECYMTYVERDRNTSMGGYRQMMGDFRAGRPMVGAIGTWVDVFRREFPGVPVPASCPADWTPRGATYANLQEAAKRSVKDALPLLGEAETKVAYDALGDLRALLRRHLDEFGG